VFQAVFLMLFYFFPDPIPALFELTAVLTLVDLAEEILLALMLPEWKADVKGLYWVLKNGSAVEHTGEDQA
jgi:CDP-diacylglycerol--glycerol-3-phosphate 3-phosphatidyltransferase